MQAHKTFFSGKVLKTTLVKMFKSEEKKKQGKLVVWVLLLFPGEGPSLFGPILSKDLSGPLSTSSKNFF